MNKQRKELQDWDLFKKQILSSQTVDRLETDAQKQARKAKLEADPVEWIKYYLPKYASKPFAKFQIKFIYAICRAKKNLFIGRAWARDHGKTTVWQMCCLFMHLTGRWKNTLIISKTVDGGGSGGAVEFLGMVKTNLETNERIINDYGFQVGKSWTEGKIIRSSGASLRAVGTGQSPRGSKNDEARPDSIIMDDADDDEVCRSPERLETLWEWVKQQLIPTFDISGNKTFIFVNNRIAEDSLLSRFEKELADDFEEINITDKHGRSTWHSQEDVEYMIQKMGGRDSIDCQKEYYNNPIIKGTVFPKEVLREKEALPLKSYDVLVAYLDPSFSDAKNSDHKSLVLVGRKGPEYHILKAFCGVASVDEMIEWHYTLYRWLMAQGVSANWYMEGKFYQKLLLKDFTRMAQVKGFQIPILEDLRDKPNKDARIVALQSYFNRGEFFFNKAEREQPGMIMLKTQFLGFKPGSTRTKKDGPDSVEGAKFKIDQIFNMGQSRVTVGPAFKNSKRF